MTRSERIEEAARVFVNANSGRRRSMFLPGFDALRAALALPVEPGESECLMCGVLEARIEELKDEATRMQARVEGAWQAGHDAHVRIEQATIEALRDRVHWLEEHESLPVEPVASAALDLNETRPCVCGCRRSKHMGDGVDGECADCMGYCKKYQPAVASAAPGGVVAFYASRQKWHPHDTTCSTIAQSGEPCCCDPMRPVPPLSGEAKTEAGPSSAAPKEER